MKIIDYTRQTSRDQRLRLAALLALITLAFSFIVVINVRHATRASDGNEPVATATTPGGASTAQNSYADLVARVAPAVVTVRSERRARPAQQYPFMNDPNLREFFGDRQAPRRQAPQSRVERGLGSGVIVSRDGYILTNHHVIDGAQQITVQLEDRRTFTAKVVGSDPPSDLAVLKIEANDLPVLALGNSDNVRVGDVALAVGNPLGLGQTVTSGIISAKGRQTGISDGSFEDFLQTDAPINQGNSGGALVNTNGELIGINSQILSPTGGNIGIGFAVPSNMAKGVMQQLVQTGRVRRGVLGVTVQPVTQEIAQNMSLRDGRGVIVSDVAAGSAAERAGLRRGDVITSFNDQPVVDSNTFRNRVAGTAPNANVTLTVSRDGREQQIRATLDERKSEVARADSTNEGDADESNIPAGKLGVGVQPLTPELASRLRIGSNVKGLVVGEVAPGGAADEAGVEQGDVIMEVNRQPVSSIETLQAALRVANNKPVLMLVNRQGNNIFLTAKIG